MWIFEDKIILIYFSALAVMLGAAMGSFLNCAAYRISHSQSFLKGRSRCPDCKATLTFPDLIPIFSYIFLRGRCRHCKKRIPVRYLLTELFFAGITLACLLRFGLTLLCLRNYVFICALFCLSLVDLSCFIIPDGCMIIPAVAWALFLPFSGKSLGDIGLDLLAALIFGGGVLLLSLLLDRLLGRESMGGGDIKLLALNGLYLGIVGSLFSLIFACLAGLAMAVIMKLTAKSGGSPENAEESATDGVKEETDGAKEEKGAADEETDGAKEEKGAAKEETDGVKKEADAADEEKDGADEEKDGGKGRIPFGPAIALSACLMLFFGEALVSWYTGLIV